MFLHYKLYGLIAGIHRNEISPISYFSGADKPQLWVHAWDETRELKEMKEEYLENRSDWNHLHSHPSKMLQVFR